MSEPRYKPSDVSCVELLECEDCGVAVVNQVAHTRFHSILASHAWALAVLKTSHIASHVHEKYDVVERIDSKKFDNWSSDALNQIIEENGL